MQRKLAHNPSALSVRPSAVLALVVLLALMPLPVAAQDTAALVEQGKTSFEDGDYAGAASLFERALAAGETTESRLYNLAVALFRAGRLDEARARFEQLLPMTDSPALVHYNLGLVALEQGRPAGARGHFSDALVLDRDGRIAALAVQQLDRLGVAPRAGSRDAWRALVQAGGGYEDNLNLAGDQLVASTSVFQEAFAWGRAPLWRRGALSLAASGVASARHYSGYDGADQTLARPGLVLDYRGTPALSVGAEAASEWQWLEAERVSRRADMALYLDWSPGRGLMQLEVGAASVDAGEDFPELSGSDRFFELAYRHPVADGLVAAAGYSWTEENRDGLVAGDDFFSASPVRHRLRGSMDYALSARWSVSAEAVWRLSRYQEDEVRGGTRTLRRREERWRLRLGSEWEVSDNWHLTLSGEWESNHARLESRDYRRTEVRVGIRRAFGR